jgi:salicylate hydroxylase
LSNNGRVVLIGDAAHATVPYLAQGAAMSIEDGAALAECLDLADNMDMVPFVLKAFEEVRKPRCETIQSVSRGNGDVWHLPDGPAQVERDSKMGKGLREQEEAEAEEELDSNSNRWSDGSFQPWLFGYDTVSEVSCRRY